MKKPIPSLYDQFPAYDFNLEFGIKSHLKMIYATSKSKDSSDSEESDESESYAEENNSNESVDINPTKI